MKDYRKAAADYQKAYQLNPKDNDALNRARAEEALFATPTPVPVATPEPTPVPTSIVTPLNIGIGIGVLLVIIIIIVMVMKKRTTVEYLK